MQEQSQLIRGLIFSLYLLLSAGTLLVFLSMALQTLCLPSVFHGMAAYHAGAPAACGRSCLP